MIMMTVYNNNNDNDVNVKDLEKNGIESTNLTLTASNIGGDSPTANNVVEGGSGPGDLSEASGNSSHGQDASSHGRNGRKMTIVLILGSLALAVATTADFDFFSKPNLLFADKAKNGSIGLQVVGPERLSKKSENLQETFLNPRSLKKSEVQCGDVVSWKVSLEENLVCDAPDGVPNSDAALTLDGPNAVLKCKGKSNKVKIVQNGGDASTCGALDGYDGNLEADPNKAEAIKDECDLPFLYGVKLLNGAKAVGCDIENFLVGAYVGQGAKELSDVTVSNNRYGVVIETNKKVKITDITAKDNGQFGILASNDGTSIFVEEYTPGGSIALKNLIASGNGGNGIEIQGSDISINSAVVIGNGLSLSSLGTYYSGIVIKFSTNIELKEIMASSNKRDGIRILVSDGISVINTEVTGNDSGILIFYSKNIDLKNIAANGNRFSGIAIDLIDPRGMKNLENIEANNNLFGIIINCRRRDFEMSWKGRISLDENFQGLRFENAIRTRGRITISGELTVDNNESRGIDFIVSLLSYVTISIAEDASFSACGNGGYDIYARGTDFTLAMEEGSTALAHVSLAQRMTTIM